LASSGIQRIESGVVTRLCPTKDVHDGTSTLLGSFFRVRRQFFAIDKPSEWLSIRIDNVGRWPGIDDRVVFGLEVLAGVVTDSPVQDHVIVSNLSRPDSVHIPLRGFGGKDNAPQEPQQIYMVAKPHPSPMTVQNTATAEISRKQNHFTTTDIVQ
jgi:hypothetical protein